MSIIHITKNAWRKMSNIIQLSKNPYGFIYSASSGGCNGFNFELNLLEKKIYEQITQNKYHKFLQSYKAIILGGESANQDLLKKCIESIMNVTQEEIITHIVSPPKLFTA